MPIRDEIKKGIACDSVGKPDSALGRAVCLSVHPGKMLLFPFLHWYRFHYAGRYKFARLLFAIDLFLIGIVLTLSAIAIYANVFLPKTFEDRIHFESSVAPREITTGAPATIVIRYTNNAPEELRNAQLTIQFPKYFVLQTLEPQQGELLEENRVALGTIPPGGTGNLHIKGVMFGDVGGEQAFQTKLTFVHGADQDIPGEKIDWHIFSPTRSALALTLELPDRMTAFQPIEGIVRYHNTGEIPFPVVSILPQWPDGFSFLKSNARLRNGQFEIESVAAGETGEFRFEGVIQEALEQITFTFLPSFTFGDDRYRQETLTHTAPVVPLPIVLSHQIDQKTFSPGATVPVSVSYKNTTDETIENVIFALESNSPFIKESTSMTIDTVGPREEKTVELSLALRPSILPTQTNVHEHLKLLSRATASYSLGDGTGQGVISKGPQLELPITTPIRLESFARYTTPGGDQIGRGPIPPQPGEETTYWVFWHIGGTTNELSNVRIEGTLPQGVRFTGKQTVSQNGSVTYDEKNQTVVWTSNEISPTLSPTSKIVGVAFELGITPLNAYTSAPLLFQDIRLTAVDAWTGAFVSASSPNISALLKK